MDLADTGMEGRDMKIDKKALRQQYREFKPEMGICMVTCRVTGSRYLKTSNNTQATYNGIWFQLNSGNFVSNRNLLEEWKTHGSENFEFKVLEVLPYDKEDPGKTDYSDELSILLDLWKENLGDVVVLP